jgi:hypothetical protein
MYDDSEKAWEPGSIGSLLLASVLHCWIREKDLGDEHLGVCIPIQLLFNFGNKMEQNI